MENKIIIDDPNYDGDIDIKYNFCNKHTINFEVFSKSKDTVFFITYKEKKEGVRLFFNRASGKSFTLLIPCYRGGLYSCRNLSEQVTGIVFVGKLR